MTNSLNFLDYVSLGVIAALGAALVLCGSLLLIKVARSFASTATPRVRHPIRTAARSKRHARSNDVYASIYRALLEMQAAEAVGSSPTAIPPPGDEALPVFAKATKPLTLAGPLATTGGRTNASGDVVATV